MKNLILIAALFIVFTIQSCEQKSNSKSVNEDVLLAFKTKFPDAEKVEWEMENESEWEAEFNWNGKEYSANFSTNGDWTETEYEIKEAAMPVDIRIILEQNFSEYELKKIEVAEKSSGKFYEMELEIGEEEFEIVIDSKGNLTKTKKNEENDKNDKD